MSAWTSDLAQDLVITTDSSAVLPTLKAFFCRAAADWFFDKRDWQEQLGSFLTFLVNFSGLETEGRELSVGFLVVGPDSYWPISDLHVGKRPVELAVISPFLEKGEGEPVKERSLFPAEFEQVRKVVDKMKKKGLGWTPGAEGQPVLAYRLSSENGIEPKAVFLLPRAEEGVGTHQAYSDLSRGSWKNGNGEREQLRGVAVQLRPSSSIRVYGGGRMRAEIMRLRDAAGWAVRHMRDLSENVVLRLIRDKQFFKRYMKEKEDDRDEGEVIEDAILYPLIDLSEGKEGGTLCFVSRAWYRAKNTSGTTHCLLKDGQKRRFFDVPAHEMGVYLAQDGAVAVDIETGELLGVGCYFEGVGGRKGIAGDVAWGKYKVKGRSRRKPGLAFVVSHDGPIYVHSTDIGRGESHATKFLEAEKRGEVLPKAKAGDLFWRLDFFKNSCGEVRRKKLSRGVVGGELVKCPKCEHEFQLESDGDGS